MDLCDSCTHISCQGQETIWSVPTRIGKEPDSDVWRVSEESAGGALEGMVVEDKLLSLAMKDGTATIDGVRYEGLYLLKMFLKQVLAIPRQASGKEEIENLVITVPKLEVKLVDCLMYCADFLEIDRSRVHVISHAESFVYYVMSQKREVWSNQVGMFELSENGLHYYELRVQRGLRQMQVKWYALCASQRSSERISAPRVTTSISANTRRRLQICCIKSAAQSVCANPLPVRMIAENRRFCSSRSAQEERIRSAIWMPASLSIAFKWNDSSSSS